MHSLVFCMQFSWVIRAFSSTKYLEAYLLLYTCLLTLLFLFECNRDPSIITLLFALSFEWSKAGSDNRIHSLIGCKICSAVTLLFSLWGRNTLQLFYSTACVLPSYTCLSMIWCGHVPFSNLMFLWFFVCLAKPCPKHCYVLNWIKTSYLIAIAFHLQFLLILHHECKSWA